MRSLFHFILAFTSFTAVSSTRLEARADCKTQQVKSGDSCGALASRCGISASDFTKYNPDKNLCSSLQPGQYVCCSAGILPDRTPKPNSDGSCATHKVLSEEYCSLIASSNSITVDKIETFNKKTWGWNGCDLIEANSVICISSGSPPMPAVVDNAICGPQMPGTKKPANMDDLTKLNPCPLNACCNKYGQCGITEEFCTPSKSATGAPGSAKKGENGCISNCGTSITNNAAAPPSQFHIGYFEAWNKNRPCQHMDVKQVDPDTYTHIHFAFAGITNDYKVNVSGIQDQFDKLKAMKAPKRILSFGGWSFSTEGDTFPIFREGVTAANRQLFAKNVVAFIQDNNLDGVDFDWEYPGAPDIPGLPPGSKNDGPNYLAFLKDVRSQLKSDKSISIAAPASYWYLKGFPIKEIAQVVDYIVYMTYDLHGQWDYANTFAAPGCPEGSCLRSHVNYTETLYSLAMVTKAGVPANKLVVGIASYGRGFKKVDPNCNGPMCKFTGPESGATKGQCTDTAGYISNAEIDDILANDKSASTHYDKNSDSNILQYGNDWVAYMDGNTRTSRINSYASKNFLGWVEWAVDLAKDYAGLDENGDPWGKHYEWSDCDAHYNNLDDIISDAGKIPDYCMNVYITSVLSDMVTTALNDYQDIIDDGYDGKFDTYRESVLESLPDALNNFIVSNGDKYFNCALTKYRTCCSDCQIAQCIENCDHNKNCKSGTSKQTTPCPKKIYSTDLIGDHGDENLDWSWSFKDDSAKDSFFVDLLNATGIDESWVKTDVRITSGLATSRCQSSNPFEDCYYHWDGYLQAKSDIDLPNPKDIIGKALSNYTKIRDQLSAAVPNLAYALQDDPSSDYVDGASIPVLMANASIAAMKSVVETANKIEEAERKEMILGFISAFLFLIPAVGEGIAALGFATLSRIILIAGDLAETGLGIYGAVEDPKSAIFLLFGALFRGANFREAAALRRGLKDSEVTALGPSVRGGLDKIDKVKVACMF